jgi:hypothetical protein
MKYTTETAGKIYIYIYIYIYDFCHKWFRNSSNVKLAASTILEAAVLVLLMGGIYQVCC